MSTFDFVVNQAFGIINYGQVGRLYTYLNDFRVFGIVFYSARNVGNKVS